MRDRRHIESGVAGKSFLIALLFLALVACSTKSSTKPPDTTTMQPQQKVATAKQIKTAASNSGSSLDAHREGKAPASGPLKDIYFDFDQYNLSRRRPRRAQVPFGMAEEQCFGPSGNRRILR